MTVSHAFELAVQHRRAGRLAEAEAICRQILTVEPCHADSLHMLGMIAHQAGRSDVAVEWIERAISLIPTDPWVHSNLGVACQKLGEFDAAIAAYHRALQLKPDFVDAYNNLGIALKEKGQFDDALAAYRQALELKPDCAEVYNNIGIVLGGRGRFEEAIAAYHRALALQPDSADTLMNLGNVLKNQGLLDEAMGAYRRALEIQPDCVPALSNLLLGLQYLAEVDGEAIFGEHCRWDEIHARALAKGIEPHANDANPDRRLRIGYVSPDFRAHSVAFFLEKLLVSHDRGQVEVFCYADLRRADAVTARLREQAGHWREITGMTDAQAAELIRRDQIDILVDLAGHTAHNRLSIFARRPAPVQVNWLGYCDTTGMKAMDYRLTDAHADPPGTTEHLHTEELVRLPETFACFRPSDEAPSVGVLPALTRGRVTFASFHNLAKLNDPLLETWAKILRQVPGSRLMLVAAGLDEGSCRDRFSEFFGRHGIGSERLEIKGRVPLAEYLALHHEVDVLLDSHPFSGHTMSCHALWMGVPVVTLAGDRHCARMVASVLTNVGLPEWIAHTREQYVEIASALAADLPRLAALRASLRDRMGSSPLLDGPRFARNVEGAYRQMWRTWCANRSRLQTS